MFYTKHFFNVDSYVPNHLYLCSSTLHFYYVNYSNYTMVYQKFFVINAKKNFQNQNLYKQLTFNAMDVIYYTQFLDFSIKIDKIFVPYRTDLYVFSVSTTHHILPALLFVFLNFNNTATIFFIYFYRYTKANLYITYDTNQK